MFVLGVSSLKWGTSAEEMGRVGKTCCAQYIIAKVTVHLMLQLTQWINIALQVNKPSVIFIDEIDALATRYGFLYLS